jgi:hypothetical protein
MNLSEALPLFFSPNKFFIGACRAFHVALFLERTVECDLDVKLSDELNDGESRRRRVRITCEAKGSMMRDVKEGFSS